MDLVQFRIDDGVSVGQAVQQDGTDDGLATTVTTRVDGVYEVAVSSAAGLVRRSGVVVTDKDDWTVGANAWVAASDGSWTETAQTDPDLWVGRAVTANSVDVQKFSEDAEPPWTMGCVSLASGSVAATEAGTGYINLSGRKRTGYITIQVLATFGGSPDGNVRVDVYGTSDGTNYDTEVLYTQTITYGTSATKRLSIPAQAVTPKFKVVATNLDSADAVTLAIGYAE